MGFFDLFRRPKTLGEFAADTVTKGDFSTTTVDGKKVAAVAAAVAGAAVVLSKEGADVSHANSVLQDEAARRKLP